MKEELLHPCRGPAPVRGAVFGAPLLAALLLACPAGAQLLTNLETLIYQLPAGDPSRADPADGPKAITSADFDGDGKADLAIANTDGSVTVYLGKSGGRFGPPLHLQTGGRSLRDIVAADFDGDGRPDIATTAPFQANVHLFYNRSTPGAPSFAPVTNLEAWHGARNLTAGDFDGDGRPDLVVAGPNNGLRQYRSLGGGVFQVLTNIAEVNVIATDPTRFPKPVYSLRSFRPPGATKDQLVMTHADTTLVWLLAPDANGVLHITGTVTNRAPAHALDVGPLLGSRTGSLAVPDLVAVQRDAGALEIHAGLATPSGDFSFAQATQQHIDVPGGPRAVEIVDLNGDGWNDLVVVARYSDSVLTYANTNGLLLESTERPVGVSPRDLVAAQFDSESDSFPDLAVMNRGSADITVLLAAPQLVGYRGVNHVYLVDGNVTGLTVLDFNGDGRADVIQLHGASGDFSVRLANPDGTLGLPTFYTVGNLPSAQVFADVNNDDVRDEITAHLGTSGIEKGFVTVRLGISNAVEGLTFGPAKRFDLPAGVEGRLFALVPGDFNRDGHIDLVAGFLDSRVAFFQGSNDGTFTYTRSHRFANQPRGLVAGDFDHDGDLDLAGIGINGELWVIENPGSPAGLQTNLLLTATLNVQVYPPPSSNSFGGRRIIALDQNGDGDLDLVLGSGKGAWLYPGGPGLSFVTPPVQLADTTHFISDLIFADVDHDGNQDLVISCRGQDCISIFTRTNGTFIPALPLDAPASRFLATGDLDGDGLPDLVGSGRILWTALSGHPPQETPPLSLADQRSRLTNIVINELLAINTLLPVDEDGDRLVDWVELFNGGTVSLSLSGWKLRHIRPEDPGVAITNDFSFPNTAFFALTNRMLVMFSDEKRTLYHTGFRLSGDGGSLLLLNAAGATVDRVDYPPQRPNISYGRFRDGQRSFVFNPFPSPRRANVFNGVTDPLLRFGGVDPATFKPGLTNRFFADVSAEVGVSYVTMYYQLLNQPNSEVQTLQLYDDGLHGDGQITDGRFAGDIEGSLPSGAEIQFYFEITDLNDQTLQVPDEAEFGEPGFPGNAYQLAFPAHPPPLELSELLAHNTTGLRDETNATPDWIEVRNVGPAPVSMDGVALSQQLGDTARYSFPAGTVLGPGGCFVVFCDSNPDQGPRHAPFRLNSDGDLVMLTGLTENRSRTLIDWVNSPPLDADQAFARLGAGGTWHKTAPTPGQGNIAASWLGVVETNGPSPVFAFAFQTITNATFTVQHAPDIDSGTTWTNLQSFPGDGIEKVIRTPLVGSGFFRVIRSP